MGSINPQQGNYVNLNTLLCVAFYIYCFSTIALVWVPLLKQSLVSRREKGITMCSCFSYSEAGAPLSLMAFFFWKTLKRTLRKCVKYSFYVVLLYNLNLD